MVDLDTVSARVYNMNAAGYVPGMVISMEASNIINTENNIFNDGATRGGRGCPGLE